MAQHFGTKRSEPHEGMKTPWGKAQHVTKLLEGIYLVSTSGHGGLKLSAARNAQMHKAIRSEGGWYEEDLLYAWVILHFPELVERHIVGGTLEGAHKTLRSWYPNEYEAVFGGTVDPSESVKRREQIYAQQHPDAWVTTAAMGDWHKNVPKGMVGVCATPARYARSGRGGPMRYFLVPSDDYDNPALLSPLGFVCEPSPSPNAPYQEIGSL